MLWNVLKYFEIFWIFFLIFPKLLDFFLIFSDFFWNFVIFLEFFGNLSASLDLLKSIVPLCFGHLTFFNVKIGLQSQNSRIPVQTLQSGILLF